MRLSEPGVGRLEVALVNGCSTAVRSLAHSPLKLLVPRNRAAAVWAYASTYGGGLLAGDSVAMDLRLGRGACCLLSTQASTKVYPAVAGVGSAQSINATVEPDALLVVAPDPLTCFDGAIYRQQQRVDLAQDASLALLDWMTAGRTARGERWCFERYRSRNDIFVGGRHILADATLLQSDSAGSDIGQRMRRYDCLATLVLLGPRLRDESRRILDSLSASPIDRSSTVLYSISPLVDGLILRIAGIATEPVAQLLHERLRFLGEHLGGNPWLRKW